MRRKIRTVSLTEACSKDGTPAYLTPEMSAWFNGQIQPLRHGAVQDVVQAFHNMVGRTGLRGRLIEHEFDQIELHKFQNMAHERTVFEHKTDIENVHRNLLAEQQRYQDLRNQHGREAAKWRPVVYYGTLFLMIFIFEGLINFESFLSISGFTPALSTGSFLVASTAYAVSAHLVGMTFRQWRERLGGAVSGTEKMKNRFVLSLAIILFSLSFAFVIYARWSLFQDIILRKSQTTGEEIGTEEILRFAGTLLGNVIVYVIGIIWFGRLS